MSLKICVELLKHILKPKKDEDLFPCLAHRNFKGIGDWGNKQTCVTFVLSFVCWLVRLFARYDVMMCGCLFACLFVRLFVCVGWLRYQNEMRRSEMKGNELERRREINATIF